MKKLFVLMAVLFLFISACSDSTDPTSNFGKIKIRVLNVKDSKPISGVLITTNPPTQSVISSDSGTYLLENIEPGDYQVFALKLGFITNSTNVSVLANKTSQADILLYDESFNNTIPDKPVLKTPGNNSSQIKSEANLTWECTDKDNDQLTYTLYFDNVNPPSKILDSNFTQNSYKIQGLLKNTEYFWYIIARDKYSSSPKSEIFSFKIDTLTSIQPNNIVLNMPFDASYNDISKSNLSSYCSSPDYSTGRKGEANGAFAFLSRNTITVRDNYAIDFTNNFSVSFWINPNNGYGFDMIDNSAHILGRVGGTGPNSSSWWVELSNQGNIIFRTYNTSTSTSTQSSNKIIEVGKWTHICIIYSYSTVSFYINGELDLVTSIPPPQISTYDLHIGGRVITDNRYFNGYLDDLKIFNKVLTSDEVSSLYNE